MRHSDSLATLPDFGRTRLLVAGDVMLDRYWTGPTQRISPEAPVPVVRIQKNESRPGGAANVALNAAALGARTRLLGVVGKDEPARLLREAFAACEVEAAFLESGDKPTVTKLRVMSRNQQLIRLDFEESLSGVGAFDRRALLRQFEAALEEAQLVILSDYGKGTLADAPTLIRLARAANKRVLVDPKGRDYSIYRGATVLTPNLAELEAVVGPWRDDVDLIARGEKLREALELEALLITRSEQGMTLIPRGAAPLQLPTQAREVYDVTGAGDTVIATLGACLAAGRSLAQAARLANLAAGIKVSKLGTATVSVTELRRALRNNGHAIGNGVLSEPELLARVQEARAEGRILVMTNGCFDVLHAGHVRYLEAARKLGDVLIVAVNDDASVRRLKGASRPLYPLRDRLQLLAALKAVDWVVPFSEDTPERLISAILPDRLVKGGDYAPEQVAGHEAVTRNGGQVVILPFHHGYSTSRLVERLQAASPALILPRARGSEAQKLPAAPGKH